MKLFTLAIVGSPFQALNLAIFSAQTQTTIDHCVIASRGNTYQTLLIEDELRRLGFRSLEIVDVRGEGTRPWANLRVRRRYSQAVPDNHEFQLVLGNYFSVAGWSLSSQAAFSGRIISLDDGIQTLLIERTKHSGMVSHFRQLQAKKFPNYILRFFFLAHRATLPVTFFTSFRHPNLANENDSVLDVDWQEVPRVSDDVTNIMSKTTRASVAKPKFAVIIGSRLESLKLHKYPGLQSEIEKSIESFANQWRSERVIYIPHRADTTMPSHLIGLELHWQVLTFPIEQFLITYRDQICAVYSFRSSALATARKILGPNKPIVFGATLVDAFALYNRSLRRYIGWWELTQLEIADEGP